MPTFSNAYEIQRNILVKKINDRMSHWKKVKNSHADLIYH